MKFNAVALIGGSFDPIHNGHIAMGEQALLQLPIDKVYYVPTKQNPLKKTTETSYLDRCNMIALALDEHEKMELYQNDAIYTIDLIHLLLQKNPNTKYYFVIGDDQVEKLSQWKNIEELLQLVTICAFTREGKRSESIYPITYLRLDNRVESSTKVREGFFEYVDKKVYDYIFEKHLYLEAIVANSMNEYRYKHTLSVIETAQKLAKAHHKDEAFLEDMYFAALFHDICKCWDTKELQVWMEQYFPDKLHAHPNVWHSYVGSMFIQKRFLIKNPRIISAIYNHTILEEMNDFNLVLKLADTIEPTRKNVPEVISTEAFIDLHKSYQMLEQKYREMREKI